MSFNRHFGKKKKRGNKYGSKPSTYKGRSFASGLERAMFEMLDLRQAAGELRDLKGETSVYLTDSRILYKPDATAFDIVLNQQVWYEAKGFKTPSWGIKCRLWKDYGPGRLEIYEGSARDGFRCTKIVEART